MFTSRELKGPGTGRHCSRLIGNEKTTKYYNMFTSWELKGPGTGSSRMIGNEKTTPQSQFSCKRWSLGVQAPLQLLRQLLTVLANDPEYHNFASCGYYITAVWWWLSISSSSSLSTPSWSGSQCLSWEYLSWGRDPPCMRIQLPIQLLQSFHSCSIGSSLNILKL